MREENLLHQAIRPCDLRERNMSNIQQRENAVDVGDQKSAFSMCPLTHDGFSVPDTSLCKSNVERSRPE
jgi:hypothetical protein